MTLRTLHRFGMHLAVSGWFLLAMHVAKAQDFVYVNNDVFGPNTVSAFEVTGAGLVPVLGSPFPTGGNGSGGGFFASSRIIICVIGDFLYVSNGGSNTISVFKINANGTLGPPSTFATGGTSGSGISLGVTPDGMYLLAGNAGSRNISVFDIATTPGTPFPVPGSPFSVPATGQIDGLRVTPDGQFVGVTEPSSPSGTGVIHMLSIAGSGAVAPIFGSPFPDSGLAGAGVAGLDVTCKSDRLYGGEATGGTTLVSVYDIDDGTVTGTPGSLVPNSIANPGTGTNSNVVLLSRDQQHLFVSNQISSQISVFDIGAGGGLTPVLGSPFSLNTSPLFPTGLATNLAGTLLYSANFGGSVSVFDIAASGALTEIGGSPFPTPVGTTPLSIAAYPSSICGQIPVANDDPTPSGPDDPIEANSGETINIDVLANDEMLNDGVAAVTTTTPASGGTAVVQADFTVDYTSALAFGGMDTFTYMITDINGDESGFATVKVNVDGSVAVTPSGSNLAVFGGAASAGNMAPLSASVDISLVPAESSTLCCTIRDPRVGAGNIKKEGAAAYLWEPFDIGAAMSTWLADEDCAALPQPNPDELIVARHFGVHTQNPNSTNPEDYRFGLCVVITGLDLIGPVSVDIVANDVVGYPVDCKLGQGVEKQPLTIARSTIPPEFAQDMRSVTTQCEPRGVAKWSHWYFIVNGQHLTFKESSKTYVGRMSSLTKDLIEAMRTDGAVSNGHADSVKALVLDAEALFKAKKASAADAQLALVPLDDATLLALDPPGSPYTPTPMFDNPEGELVSHLAALRYAVCSERAFPDALGNCAMNPDVLDALPTLVGGPPP